LKIEMIEEKNPKRQAEARLIDGYRPENISSRLELRQK
jgi:hypothetical protein